jgi:hypothetical protein
MIDPPSHFWVVDTVYDEVGYETHNLQSHVVEPIFDES